MGLSVASLAVGLDSPDTDLLIRHYAVAGPLIERLLGGIPFVWATLPGGFDGPTIYHGPLAVKTLPKAPVVDVPTRRGVRRYPKLSADRIEGLVRHGAVEVHSWSPTADDPTRVGYARLLLETRPSTPREVLFDGMLAFQHLLVSQEEIDVVPVLDGGTGAALWIPFTDGPDYASVRVWLHHCCEIAVRDQPNLFTLEPNTHADSLVHLHVASNAIGRFSVLPYSARASAGFPVALPIDPSKMPHFANVVVRAGELDRWLETNRPKGDPSATAADWFQYAATAAAQQKFGDRARRLGTVMVSGAAVRVPTHGPIVAAAIEVLQDGHSRTAEEILSLALQRGLLDSKTTHKYVYTSLIEYIARANGNGRKPAIVQNADRSFRINEPPDDWPDVEEPPQPAPPPEIAALIDRLRSTAQGPDPAAFEQAVCDAFGGLGFAATHVGGQKAPDGYADALLGPLAYRTTIECKSGDEGINDPSVFEASKFREAYGASYCALVARAFSGENELITELHNHAVSAWTIEDLRTLLLVQANPLEMRPLFAAGFAADALSDLLWERHHGRRKRVALIADAIVRTGWTTQAAYRGVPSEAPRLTEDALMVLVDQDLAAQGSAATCSRDDVRAACAYLANPLVGLAEQDPSDGSVTVVTASFDGVSQVRSD